MPWGYSELLDRWQTSITWEGRISRYTFEFSTLMSHIKIQKKTLLVTPTIRTLPNNDLMKLPQLGKYNNDIGDDEMLISDLDLPADFWKGTHI